MASVAILINGSPTPITNIVLGATVTLTNGDNSGVSSWSWEFIDIPTGSTATLAAPTTATSTFTADKEGSYLVKLTLNGSITGTGLVAVLHILSGVRLPAFRERTESGVRGWTAAVDDALSTFGTEVRGSKYLVAQSGAALTAGKVVRVTSDVLLGNGTHIPVVQHASASSLSTLPGIGVVVDNAGGSGVNVRVKIFGILSESTLDTSLSSVGAVVYVNNSGDLSLSAGTQIQTMGTVATVSATGRVFISSTASTTSGVNTGDVTLTAVGSSPSANAASLSGQILTLQPADATHPGVVTTGTQTLAGAKTFSGGVTTTRVDVNEGGSVPGLHLSVGGADSGTYLMSVDQEDYFLSGGAAYNGSWIAKHTNAGVYTHSVGVHGWYADAGLTPGNAFTPTIRMSLNGSTGNLVVTGTAAASNLSGTNTGDVTLAAVGASPNANGASLSGQALTLQPASGSNPGVLTSGTQTIGGAKTFSGNVAAPIYLGAASAGAVVQGQVADGGSAVGVVLDNNVTLANAGAKLLSVKNNGTERAYLTKDGSFAMASPSNGTRILAPSTGGYLGLDGGLYCTGGGVVQASGFRGDNTGSVNITSWVPDGAATMTQFDTGNAITNAAAKLVSIKNFTTEKLYIDKDGSITTSGGLAATGAVTGSNLSGTNTGNITLTAVGAVPSANGASLSGQALTLQPVDATHPGVVTTGSQTIAGAKTFTSDISSTAFVSPAATSAVLRGQVADSGAAVGVVIDNNQTLSTLGAKILSIKNNGSELIAIDRSGSLAMPTLTAITWGSGIGFAGCQNGAGTYTGFCVAMPNGTSWPVPTTVFHYATAISNTSTTETTLATYLANQFGNDGNFEGRGWKIKAFGTFAANGNTKTIRLKFGPGPTDVLSGNFTGAFNGGSWRLETSIMRTSDASHQVACSEWSTSSAVPVSVNPFVLSMTEATASSFNIVLTGQSGTGSNDVTLSAMRIEWLP